jgi:hypothetical protein
MNSQAFTLICKQRFWAENARCVSHRLHERHMSIQSPVGHKAFMHDTGPQPMLNRKPQTPPHKARARAGAWALTANRSSHTARVPPPTDPENPNPLPLSPTVRKPPPFGLRCRDTGGRCLCRSAAQEALRGAMSVEQMAAPPNSPPPTSVRPCALTRCGFHLPPPVRCVTRVGPPKYVFQCEGALPNRGQRWRWHTGPQISHFRTRTPPVWAQC